jgi:adenylate cyclase
MKNTTFCRGCWEQRRIPIGIRGAVAVPYRMVGINRSQMHPNLCTLCEVGFQRMMKQKQVDVETTVLFADLRGYTQLSGTLDATRMNRLLHTFYDRCSAAVWEHDGIVNKFIGDAMLAIYNFPLMRAEHARNAVRSAMELQRQCRNLKEEIGLDEEQAVGVGIGIHTGISRMGEVGNAFKDFTAIGPVVNLASRLQTAARAGEILITPEVHEKVKDMLPTLPSRSLELKGIDGPVNSYVFGAEVLATV